MQREYVEKKYLLDTNHRLMKAVALSSSGQEKKNAEAGLAKARSNSSRAEIIRKEAERARKRIKGGERKQRELELDKLHKAIIRLKNAYSLLSNVKNLNIVEWSSILADVITRGEKVEFVTRKAIENTTNY